MSLFDIDEDNMFPTELNEVVRLLPNKTKGVGKVTSAKAVTKFRDENHPKSPNTIWSQLTLNVATRCEDMEELIGVPESNFRYQFFVRCDDLGLPTPSGNENFAKFLSSFGIDMKDSDLKSGISDIDKDSFESREAYFCERVRVWWQNLGDKLVDAELDVVIGIDEGSDEYPEKRNIISRVAKRKED